MVIDKTGIMEILRDSEEDLKAHKGEDSILITTIYDDFSKDQIGNDSIDLRISNKGYILSDEYEFPHKCIIKYLDRHTNSMIG